MAESRTTRSAEAEAARRAERAARRAADLELVQATLRGEKSAYETLFTQYREKVYGVVYGYVRDKDDALDITQDAFVKGFKKLGSFRAQDMHEPCQRPIPPPFAQSLDTAFGKLFQRTSLKFYIYI